MKQLATSRNLRGFSGLRPPVLEWGARLLLFVLLGAPSIWMLSVIPPLWRDIDAYIQVTQPPGAQTILLYGPPYGVLALVLSQHVALCCSAFYLISVASRLFLVRLLLACAWALNPLFYTFAHCVGSETLSMILLLLFGATGIRIISHRRKVPGGEWLLFGLLLWLTILTRHLNALLAMVMPVTFFLLSAHQLAMTAFARSRLMRRGQRLWARQSLQKAAVTLVIGLSCIVLANVSLRGLCYAAHIRYQFPAGFAFLWRLKFLATLPAETGNKFLDRLARDISAPDVKKVISQLREAIHETTDWESTAFMRETQASLFAPGSKSGEELMPVLNRTVLAFLWPPRDVFVRAVATDFAKARMITVPSVARSLFVHTIFYYSYCDAMPGYAPLEHFSRQERGRDTSLLQATFILLPSKGVYLQCRLVSLVCSDFSARCYDEEVELRDGCGVLRRGIGARRVNNDARQLLT